MSDQKEIETSRYARKTVTVRGLMRGTHDPKAKKIMAEHGIMWDLTGQTKSFEETTVSIKTHFIEGEELPSGFTTAERKWVMELAEKHGLDYGTMTEERNVVPEVPYMKVPIRFSTGDQEWSELQQTDRLGQATLTAELDRGSKVLTLTIEGKSKDEVANDMTDEWIQGTVRHVRDALKAAGFTEGELEIDCEVIMGAEREAQCDPTLMRSLLTTNKESEEE